MNSLHGISGKTTLELIRHYLPHPLHGAPLDSQDIFLMAWAREAESHDWRVPMTEEGSGHVVPVQAPVRPGAGYQHPLGGLHCRLSPVEKFFCDMGSELGSVGIG